MMPSPTECPIPVSLFFRQGQSPRGCGRILAQNTADLPGTRFATDTPLRSIPMNRLSPALAVCTLLLSSPAFAQSSTCDAEFINRDSYRLSTDAQALNVTRPRTNWWD